MGAGHAGFNARGEKWRRQAPREALFDLFPAGNPYNAAPWNSQNDSASIFEVWATH
jgi:hypothetical protein